MILEDKINRIWNILNTDVGDLSKKSIRKIIKSCEDTGKISKKDAECFYNQLNNKKIIEYIDDFFVHTAVLNASGWFVTGFILKDYSNGEIDLKTAAQGLFWLGTYARTMWTSYEISKKCLKEKTWKKIPLLTKEFKTSIYNNIYDIYETTKYKGLKQGYSCLLKNVKSGILNILRSDRVAALIFGIAPYAGSGAYAAQITLGTEEERKFGFFCLKTLYLKSRIIIHY